MLLRRVDDHADVLTIVLRQRQLDRFGLDGRGVLVDGAVRRLDAEDLLAALQERRADDVEHFAGAGGDHDVLGLDAVELGDRLADARVRDSRSGRRTSRRLPSTS